MAYIINAPDVPTRPMWYEPPMRRHEAQVPRLPWGNVPVMTPPGGMAPVQDYHPGYRGYRGYGQPVEEKSCAMVGIVSTLVAGTAGLVVGGIVGLIGGIALSEEGRRR